MRSRNLKPGFFTNEELAELPFEARILFEGLWCYSDREGRFEWRPKKIKAEIFPYDNLDIEPLLMSLHVRTFIYKYTLDGHDYGFIPTFHNHQSPHPHEAKTKIPEPPKEIIEEIQRHGMSDTSKLPVSDLSVKCQADIRNEDIRNPSSLREGEGKKPSPPSKKKIVFNKGQPNPEIKIFIDFYAKRFKEKFGNDPIIEGGKDGSLVKGLLGKITLQELQGLLVKFFESEDSWIKESGYTIGAFKSQIQKLRIGSSKNGNPYGIYDKGKKVL